MGAFAKSEVYDGVYQAQRRGWPSLWKQSLIQRPVASTGILRMRLKLGERCHNGAKAKEWYTGENITVSSKRMLCLIDNQTVSCDLFLNKSFFCIYRVMCFKYM